MIIRWWGLLLFVGVLVLALVLGRAFAPWLIRVGIEDVASRIWGAQIDVADVDIGFVPLGLTLQGLAFTDPGSPMQNLLEIENVHFALDPWKLALGQILVDEAEVLGIQVSTPRKRSGALHAPEGKARQVVVAALDLAFELPDISMLLGKAPTLTEQRLDDWRQWYPNTRRDLERRRDALPDKDRLKSYEERWETLKAGKIRDLAELAERRQALKELHKDIKGDLQQIKDTRQAYSDSLKQAREKLGTIKAGPRDDLDRLSAGLGLSGEGGAVQALIEPQLRARFDQAMGVYERLQPLFADANQGTDVEYQRPQGRFVRFPTAHPLPDLLVKKVAVSARLETGDFSGQIRDITTEPWIIQRPLTFQLRGQSMAALASLELTGKFDHIRPEKARDQLGFAFVGARVKDLAVSGDHVQLTKATVKGSGELVYGSGRFTSTFNSQWQDAHFTGKADNKTQEVLLRALGDVRQFTLAGRAEFSDAHRNLRIDSDLDHQLKQSVIGQAKERLQAWRAEGEARLMAEVRERLGQDEASLAALDQEQGQFDSLEGQLKSLLEAKLEDVIRGSTPADGGHPPPVPTEQPVTPVPGTAAPSTAVEEVAPPVPQESASEQAAPGATAN